MTIRLGHVLPKVISLSQSGFGPGRLLSDNVLLAQALVHSLESHRPEANVVFKLDMAKAYDRVSWEFLYQVLRWKGFPQCWIGLVANAVSHCLFSVLVNGLGDDESLRWREAGLDSKCVAGHSVASASEETVSHLFIESTVVQGVWQHFAALFGLCLCDTGSLTHMVHFWRYSTPFHSDLHIQKLIPFLILWFTWTQQNAVKYHGVLFSTDGIILEVQRYLRTLYAARTLTSIQWKGDLHRAAVMGFIFRQTVPRAPSISALGTGTSVPAELTAVWRGLELALTHGLAPLVVEVDATVVILLLQSRISGKWEVQHLIMRIVRLQQLLVADVQHVFREASGAADHLTKEAASLQLTWVLHHNDITGVLRGILCLDRRGFPHLCRG
ncbi:UNVERIFIED_CONTAM: hypothetical protein Sradi_5839700 [Sesamum radiatum]|uniref:RNase H type-1 domain-containing protein n=1 Tax=Sesamum radiatum TaxID=300843 RepID=A0AAW2KQI8_SESRA